MNPHGGDEFVLCLNLALNLKPGHKADVTDSVICWGTFVTVVFDELSCKVRTWF